MGWNQDKLLCHIAMRAWLPEWPSDGLWKDFEAYTKNPGGWFGIPATGGVVSLLLGRESPYFVNWEPAMLITGSWNAGTSILTAHLSATKKSQVSISNGAVVSSFTKRVKSVTCDGKNIPFKLKEDLVYIDLPAGDHKIQWIFE
jgi:hypothetical protein